MPFSFVIYPSPLSAKVVLTPDGAPASLGQAYTAPDGRQGQVCYVGDDVVSGHGAGLSVEANDHVPFHGRGFLLLENGVARLQVDDVTLTETPATPPPDPNPEPGDPSPEEIIMHVYDTTHPNLATVEGCGKFTEDVCTALHLNHSAAWGHVDKDPGQNQYNGHAVDAVMLLNNHPDGTAAGIYDIIFSSASPEAKPSFNYAGPPNYADWVYPADATHSGITFTRRAAR